MSKGKVKEPRLRPGHLVQTRLEDKDFRAVERLAKAEGRAVGTWVRELIRKELMLHRTAFERFVK